MPKAEQIEEYIKTCFELFSFDTKEFFYYDFADDGWCEMEWAMENGKVHPELIGFASEILGISEEDILSLNYDQMRYWLNKYPYITDVRDFNNAYVGTYYGPGYANLRLMEAIFDEKHEELYPLRYDYDDVESRLLNELKEMDKSLPGTYHKGETLRYLEIGTENFCRYEKIRELAESFISMIERSKELFIRAVRSGLDRQEVLEYNFLVTYLGLRDRFYPDGYLYYSNLERCKDVYSAVTEQNLSEYIVYKKIKKFTPWKCIDFIADKKLVEQYLLVVPEAKALMRKHAVAALNFRCSFTWSDASSLASSMEGKSLEKQLEKLIEVQPLPEDLRTKERTEVFVRKTKEELGDDAKAAETLAGYCRPEKLGGIKVGKSYFNPETYDKEMVSRLSSLLGKIKKNNFVERLVDEANKPGGGCHE